VKCTNSDSNWLRAERSWDRIPVGARFSAPVQTGPGAHPASCTVGTGFLPGVKSGRGVTLTPHPLLASWSRRGTAIPLLPLWAVRPVQSLGTCTRVHFNFSLQILNIIMQIPQLPISEYIISQSVFIRISLPSPRTLTDCSILGCDAVMHCGSKVPEILRNAMPT